MVYRRYEDVLLEYWEHIASSRFGVQPPFICLKAQSESCEIVLKLLDELSALQPAVQRIMTLAPNRRPNRFSRIRFSLMPASDDLSEMALTKDLDTAEFEFIPNGLKRFQDAVSLWNSGQEDFCVRPLAESTGVRDKQSGEVWFWRQSDP